MGWLSAQFSCHFIAGYRLTCSFNEILVMLPSQQGIWQFSEELFQQAGHAVHIMEESLREAEVQLVWI